MSARLKNLAWYWFCKGWYAAQVEGNERKLRKLFLGYWKRLSPVSPTKDKD